MCKLCVVVQLAGELDQIVTQLARLYRQYDDVRRYPTTNEIAPPIAPVTNAGPAPLDCLGRAVIGYHIPAYCR